MQSNLNYWIYTHLYINIGQIKGRTKQWTEMRNTRYLPPWLYVYEEEQEEAELEKSLKSVCVNWLRTQ